jgi:hypothetical protein
MTSAVSKKASDCELERKGLLWNEKSFCGTKRASVERKGLLWNEKGFFGTKPTFSILGTKNEKISRRVRR